MGTLATILVVDDNEEVRKVAVAILEQAGFRVLWANSGPSALKLANETNQEIHLLISNVSLKEISGPDLGEMLKKTRPDMHVMLMSGGAHGSLLVLNYGWAIIAQASLPEKLVEMVNDVLHSPNRSQPGGHSFDTRLDTNPNAPQAKDPEDHPAASNEPRDRGK